jgi:hypothetical protein
MSHIKTVHRTPYRNQADLDIVAEKLLLVPKIWYMTLWYYRSKTHVSENTSGVTPTLYPSEEADIPSSGEECVRI